MSKVEACEGRIHVDQLNDDCLIHVFSFLTIFDRVRIRRVCKRWQSLGDRSWSTVRAINLRPSFWGESKLLVIRDHLVKVLQLCGNYVSQVDLSHHEDSRAIRVESCKFTVSNVFNLCPKVTSLNLGKPHLGAIESTYEFVGSNFVNLNRLVVSVTKPEHEDLVGRILLSNQGLRSLTLVDSALDGSCLEYLKHENYEELTFKNCRFRTLRHLLTMLEKTRVLRAFSFVQCQDTEKIRQGSLLRAIGLNSKTLSKLELHFYEYNGWESEDPEDLSSLTDLEVLRLKGRVLVSDEFLEAVRKYCTKLREVHLEDSEEVSDDGLGHILSLPELKNLHLHNLKYITDKTLSQNLSLRKLVCVNCEKVGNEGLIKLLETSSRIECVHLEFTSSVAVEPSSLAEVGVRSKSDKLSMVVEGNFCEPVNGCVYLNYSVVKFGARAVRKTKNLCFDCFFRENGDCESCCDREELILIE